MSGMIRKHVGEWSDIVINCQKLKCACVMKPEAIELGSDGIKSILAYSELPVQALGCIMYTVVLNDVCFIEPVCGRGHRC